MNKLILGDNLEILKSLEAESVDLIYLDPPFFSNRNYEVIWGDEGEIRSFQDRWSGGIDHYIAWLKERVEEMHRILKPTGSIFLHCDWHADAYIKVFILDKIFGENNFKGSIIWRRTNAHNDAKKKIAVLTDTIWYYSKSEKYTYNSIYTYYDDKYIENSYRYQDDKGKYMSDNLTGAKINKSDLEWKGYHPASKGRSWSINKEAVIKLVGVNKSKSMNCIEKLDLLYKNNLIEITKNGTPRFKRYLDISKGLLLGNLWTDINNIQSQAKERIGYPTQKPEKLLERIISMASNEDDIILDPFLGGGTTIAVADKLNRQWLGIDQSVQAVKVSELRLQKQQDLFSKPFTVQLHKYDYDTLRYSDAFKFETWIIQQYNGIPNTKQRNDKGIDGKTSDGIPIQVKRSDNIGRNVIDNFTAASKRFDKKLFDENQQNNEIIGYIIAFSFGKGAIQEVARLKNQDNLIIQLVTVEEIIPIAKKPKLTVSFKDLGLNNKKLREIEFIAIGESEAGIEFYAWDFNYIEVEGFKAQIMIDKQGKQNYKFKTGNHQILVKVVDNTGLENFELVKLKVNGKVK
ncbi:MAG: DNA methyltransferase [Candidatus Marithrix sp.]